MVLWRKKLTPGTAWIVKHWGGCVLECSINTASISPWSKKSTEPWLAHPSYINVSPGLCIVDTSNWRNFTYEFSNQSLAFIGKTVSNLEVLDYMESTSTEFLIIGGDGRDMSSAWMTAVCLANCSTGIREETSMSTMQALQRHCERNPRPGWHLTMGTRSHN